jgi:hypothetical protein
MAGHPSQIGIREREQPADPSLTLLLVHPSFT